MPVGLQNKLMIAISYVISLNNRTVGPFDPTTTTSTTTAATTTTTTTTK